MISLKDEALDEVYRYLISKYLFLFLRLTGGYSGEFIITCRFETLLWDGRKDVARKNVSTSNERSEKTLLSYVNFSLRSHSSLNPCSTNYGHTNYSNYLKVLTPILPVKVCRSASYSHGIKSERGEKRSKTTWKWMFLVTSKQGSWRKGSEINALNVTSAKDVLCSLQF